MSEEIQRVEIVIDGWRLIGWTVIVAVWWNVVTKFFEVLEKVAE